MQTKNIYLQIKYSTCKLQIVLQIENTTVHAPLENLLLVLTWHQFELQKYICWPVFSERARFDFLWEF